MGKHDLDSDDVPKVIVSTQSYLEFSENQSSGSVIRTKNDGEIVGKPKDD